MKYTIIKTCTYAFMHMTVSITIAYLLSGSWKVALAIGAVEPCAQVAAYFMHESAWSKFLKGHAEENKVQNLFPCCSHIKNLVD